MNRAVRFSLGFHKKLIVFIAYATIAMLGAYITMYQYTVLSISQLFMLNAVMMGVLIGIQHFGMAIPPLFLGALSAKVGKKRVIIISYLLIVTGTFLVGITTEFVSFIVSVFLIGSGFSVTEATLSAVLADEFPGESTRHLSFSQVAFSVGALCGPIIAKTLIDAGLFFKDLFYCFSAVFLLLGIAFLFTRHQNDKGDKPKQAGNGHLKDFFGNRAFLLLGLSIFLYVGIENTFANYADSYYELVLRKPEFSATALALFWGAMIPSRFLAGVIKADIKKIFVVLSTTLFVSIAAAMMIENMTVKIVLFAISGFCCGPLWPLLMDAVAKKNVGSSGPSMNIMMSFSSLGGAAVPFVAGFIVNGSNETWAYYISAICAIMMMIIYLKSTNQKNVIKNTK